MLTTPPISHSRDAPRAWPEMPPAGDPRKLSAERARSGAALVRERAFSAPELDTSHVSVVDRHGNVFAATPSDGSYNAPVVPELGIIPSPRGSQSRADPDHPSGVAPGKRPRLTLNPAIAIRPGKMKMPFGTPGGDVQTQAMLQAFLNINVFDMEVQDAIEAPRCARTAIPAPSSRTTITVTGSSGGPTGLGWPAPSARSSPTSRPAYLRAAPIHAGLPMRSACRDERLSDECQTAEE